MLKLVLVLLISFMSNSQETVPVKTTKSVQKPEQPGWDKWHYEKQCFKKVCGNGIYNLEIEGFNVEDTAELSLIKSKVKEVVQKDYKYLISAVNKKLRKLKNKKNTEEYKFYNNMLQKILSKESIVNNAVSKCRIWYKSDYYEAIPKDMLKRLNTNAPILVDVFFEKLSRKFSKNTSNKIKKMFLSRIDLNFTKITKEEINNINISRLKSYKKPNFLVDLEDIYKDFQENNFEVDYEAESAGILANQCWSYSKLDEREFRSGSIAYERYNIFGYIIKKGDIYMGNFNTDFSYDAFMGIFFHEIAHFVYAAMEDMAHPLRRLKDKSGKSISAHSNTKSLMKSMYKFSDLFVSEDYADHLSAIFYNKKSPFCNMDLVSKREGLRLNLFEKKLDKDRDHYHSEPFLRILHAHAAQNKGAIPNICYSALKSQLGSSDLFKKFRTAN